MARPRDADRRWALLDAATKVFAERGLGAPTSAITTAAKVSEGSLFTYFKSKDELINELYLELRRSMAQAVMNDFPRRGSVRERLHHLWSAYVRWGVENPRQRSALRLLVLSHVITKKNRAAGQLLFADLDQLERDAVAEKKIRQLPPGIAGHVINSLGEMTRDLIEENPSKSEALIELGFQMLWGALSAA